MKIFFLSNGSKKVGPFSFQQIKEMIFKSQISMGDPIYNDQSKEWTSFFWISRYEENNKTSNEESTSEPKDSNKKKRYVAGLDPGSAMENTVAEKSGQSNVYGLISNSLSGGFAGISPHQSAPQQQSAPQSAQHSAPAPSSQAHSLRQQVDANTLEDSRYDENGNTVLDAKMDTKIVSREEFKSIQIERTMVTHNYARKGPLPPSMQKKQNEVNNSGPRDLSTPKMPSSVNQEQLVAEGQKADRWIIRVNGTHGPMPVGPYNTVALLVMALEGELNEQDLIKKVGQQDWRKLSEFEEFKVDNLKELKVDSAQRLAKRGGFRRSFARIDVDEHVIVCIGEESYRVLMGDVSEGGCSILANCPFANPGDVIFLSIFPNAENGDLDYNAHGTVLGFNPELAERDQVYKYSVKFDVVTFQLSSEIKSRLVTKKPA